MNKTGVIILAAGGSLRLGSPKQVLPLKDKTLIAHVIDEAGKALLHPVIVVIGAHAENVTKALSGKNVTIVYNENWQAGMGSGIRKGVEYLIQHTGTERIILCVCDQPFLSASLFTQLIEKQTVSRKGIIAAAYNNTAGTPVLFENKYFIALLQLAADKGARALLDLYKSDVETVNFSNGNIDIDTEEDYRELLRMISA